ncbi:hypothetical protein [Cellulomonas sp. NPDC089187]|uniref:hypothetical protein n=1 Tax=Cellulomonas sp. NPDC089187 TaxID=3154970 RepID=UPI0034374E5E
MILLGGCAGGGDVNELEARRDAVLAAAPEQLPALAGSLGLTITEAIGQYETEWLEGVDRRRYAVQAAVMGPVPAEDASVAALTGLGYEIRQSSSRIVTGERDGLWLTVQVWTARVELSLYSEDLRMKDGVPMLTEQETVDLS